MKKRVTLTFSRETSQMPVTYLLARDFNVAANIIRAQVAPNRVGTLVLELSGEIDELNDSLDWLRSRQVQVSLVSQEITVDADVCVHCGLCTGVCPTEALKLDPKTAKLSFTRSRRVW
ncbi:MAG: 4Fe-4S binding protein [Synechococcales cyanobacterium RM1_1_8]|nr:4Fe-4S binding protein [Synechococcales cyanobacterium RM1_1_8]